MRDDQLRKEEHGDLVGCVEQGYAARGRDVPSNQNPHFEHCRSAGSFVWTDNDARQMRRADAWWFGWHEADDERALLKRPGK